jgi:hypothetical protein
MYNVKLVLSFYKYGRYSHENNSTWIKSVMCYGSSRTLIIKLDVLKIHLHYEGYIIYLKT